MKFTRSIPRNVRLPSLRNVVMVDTVRGVLRVRKWPKKYGKPRSALQAWWIDWFKQANLLAKYADPMSQRRAIELTKGSGLYPRDVLLQAMRGRLYVWRDDTGWKWYPVAAIGDISESLDVLAQTIGSVLVRATDRWRSAVAGNPGDVLTYQGNAAPPEWVTPAAAGSAIAALLTLTANPTIANATFTPIVWGAEVYDLGGYVDLAVQPTRFTAPAGAAYARLSGNIAWANNGVGERIIQIQKNGAAVAGSGWERNPNSDGLVAQNFQSAIIPWAETDYLELSVYQSSGGNLTLESTSTSRNWACLESWS